MKKLSLKQMKIARMAKPFNKITGADFKKLRSMKKIKRIQVMPSKNAPSRKKSKGYYAKVKKGRGKKR